MFVFVAAIGFYFCLYYSLRIRFVCLFVCFGSWERAGNFCFPEEFLFADASGFSPKNGESTFLLGRDVSKFLPSLLVFPGRISNTAGDSLRALTSKWSSLFSMLPAAAASATESLANTRTRQAWCHIGLSQYSFCLEPWLPWQDYKCKNNHLKTFDKPTEETSCRSRFGCTL